MFLRKFPSIRFHSLHTHFLMQRPPLDFHYLHLHNSLIRIHLFAHPLNTLNLMKFNHLSIIFLFLPLITLYLKTVFPNLQVDLNYRPFNSNLLGNIKHILYLQWIFSMGYRLKIKKVIHKFKLIYLKTQKVINKKKFRIQNRCFKGVEILFTLNFGFVI